MKRLLWILAGLLPLAGTAQTPAKRGFTSQIEMGVLLGQVSTDNNAPSSRTSFTASLFNGYRIFPALAAGITVGADWYRTKTVIPLSVGLRGDFLRNAKVTPFYAIDVGKGMTWFMRDKTLTEQRGGWHINPALGIRIATGGRSSITWSIGYKYQELYGRRDLSMDEYIATDYHYNRMSLRMGMSF